MIGFHFTVVSKSLGRKHFHRGNQLDYLVKSLYHCNMATSSFSVTGAARSMVLGVLAPLVGARDTSRVFNRPAHAAVMVDPL